MDLRTSERRGSKREGTERPVLTFAGSMNIEAIFDVIQAGKLLRDKLTQAKTIDAITSVLNAVQADIFTAYSESTIEEQYRELANMMPDRLSSVVSDIALQAARSTNENISQQGRNALVLLYMQTILNRAEAYADLEVDEAVQQVVFTLLDPETKLSGAYSPSQTISSVADSSIQHFIAARELFDVVAWVQDGIYKKIRPAVQQFIADTPHATEDAINWFADEFIEQPEFASVSSASLKRYVKVQQALVTWDQPADQLAMMQTMSDIDDIAQALQTKGVLSAQEVEVLRLRYGFRMNIDEPMGAEYTLEEVGRMLKQHIGRERVRQVEMFALTKLRHNEQTQLLNPSLSPE